MNMKHKTIFFSMAESNKRQWLVVVSLILLFNIVSFDASAQAEDSTGAPAVKPKRVEWYETLKIRGYAQLRYNRLFETNPDLECDQCDLTKFTGELSRAILRCGVSDANL